MKLVAEVRLLPDPSVWEGLVETLTACNRAANWGQLTTYEFGIFLDCDLRNMPWDSSNAFIRARAVTYTPWVHINQGALHV